VLIEQGKIKRIHVNKHKINKDPFPLTVRSSGKVFYGDKVKINGPSEIVFNKEHPLSCGAKVWIETKSEVILLEGEN
jgi:hypothetical protein